MENTARKQLLDQVLEDLTANGHQAEIVEFRAAQPIERDSLSLNFIEEIDAWARHALATNGFGDF